MRNTGMAVLPCVLLLTGCLTSEFELEASAGLFAPAISGDISLEPSGGGFATAVDLEDDFGLDDRDSAPYLQGRISALGLNIAGSAYDTSQRGNGMLTADFGDISAGRAVSSDFDLLAMQLAVTYNIVDVGFLRIAPGVGVDYFDIELEVTDTGTGLSESIDAKQPVPLLFLEAEVDPPVVPVDLLVQIGGIGGSYGDFDGTLIDGQALLRWEFFDNFEVYGGYRLLMFDLEGDSDGQDFKSDFDLDGWLIGAGVRF